MTGLLWHQWLALGLATIIAINAAGQDIRLGLIAGCWVAALAWGFTSSNAADRARAERDEAMTWLRREREATGGAQLVRGQEQQS